MKFITGILVFACANYVLAGPVSQTEQPARAVSLRRMLVDCLDAQADEMKEENQFTSCLSSKLSTSGEVKLLPGVVLSSEKIETSGGRAIAGRAIKLSLPFGNATARLLGGWGQPSLVLTGDTSNLDVGVELNKDEPDNEGRGKKLKKLLLPLLIGLKMKSALFGILGYGAVAALAGKALLVSIASIIISGIIALRKLYHQTWDVHAHHHPTQYSSYEPYYHHHHRSYESAAQQGVEATNQQAQISSYAPSSTDSMNMLAYKGYNNLNTNTNEG